MIAIPAKGKVQPDGTLTVSVATGLSESDVEVVVIVNPAESKGREAWPADFFDRTYGAFADDPLIRLPQG